MKKKILALLGLVSVFGLAACTDNKPKQTTSEVENKGDWGADEVKENIEKDEEEVIVDNKVAYKVSSDVSFSADDIYDYSFANKGLLVIKNSSNHIGFYSLLHNKYLIERQFIEEVVSYSLIENTQLGFILRIVYDDYAYYYDSLGNELFVDVLNNSNNVSIQIRTINKKVYAIVSGFVDEEYKTTIYEYQTDGSLKEISVLPEQEVVQENVKKSPFSKNSKYVDLNKIDLKEFGLEGYYLSVKNELITVFDSSTNEPKSTFTVPTGSKMMFVKNKLFYQNTYQTSDDATNYSYYKDGEKYIVSTYAVDVLTGEKKSVDLSYEISEVVGPYMDKDGIYNNTLVSKKSFTADHILKNPEIALVDVEGKVISNLNGYQPEFFVNIGNGYYNTVTKVLYDYNLKEVAYLGAINPTLYEKHSCFVGRAEGLYGVVDSTGKVTIPFEYQNLYTDYEQDGYVFGLKNNHLYRVNLKNGSETDLGSSYNKINNYLYLIDNNGSYKFEYVKESIGNTIYADSYYLTGVTASSLYNSTVIRFKDDPASINDSAGYEFVNASAKDVANYSTFETMGTNKLQEENLGVDYETAPTIEVGKNKLYMTRSGGNYFKFTPTQTAYYTVDRLYKSYNVYTTVYKLIEPENEADIPTYQNVSKANEDYGYVLKLEKGETYYFLISSGYTTHGTIYINLVKESGEHEKYPAIMELNEDNIFNRYEDGTYVSINSKGTGWFEISNSNDFNISFVTAQYNSQKLDDNYTFALTGPSSKTVDGKRYYELNEFTTYVVKLSKNNNLETFEYSLKYSNDEELNRKGKSLYNAFELKPGDNETLVDGITYFVYHNNSESTIRLSAQDNTFFNDTSSLAYIYRKEYNPSLYNQYPYQYERINNGTVLELEKDEEIYIRTNNVNTKISSLIINVEKITGTISTSSINSTTVTNKTYYLKPTNTGMYSIALNNVKVGDTLKGYDLYNRLIVDLKAEEAGDLTFNQYLTGNVVYKYIVNGTGTNTRFVTSANATSTNQYVLESTLNKIYINQNSLFKFTPASDGIYSINVKNQNGVNYTPTVFTINKGTDSVTTKTATINSSTYLYAELEKGVEYTITARTNSSSYYNAYNMSIEKEVGKRYFAPIELNIDEEFDATKYLADSKEETVNLYAKFYFKEPNNIQFVVTGFDTYSTSLTSTPSTAVPSNGRISVSNSNYYLFHATVSKDNLKLSVKFYEDGYKAGETSYNPIALTSLDDAIEGTLKANEAKYYSYKNETNDKLFISANIITPNTLNGFRVVIADFDFENAPSDIYDLAPGETAIILIYSQSATDFSVEIKTEKVSDYALTNKAYTLVNGEEAQKFDVLFDEVKFVEFKLESETATDAAIITIKSSEGQSLATNATTEGKVVFNYEFQKNTKYVVEITGEGEFNLTHQFVNFKVNNMNYFNLDNEEYKSTNTSTNTTGSFDIKIYEDTTISFNYLLSSRLNDYMRISKIVDGVSQTIEDVEANNTSAGISGTYSVEVKKGETLRISYVRSTSSLGSGYKGLIISNLTDSNNQE